MEGIADSGLWAEPFDVFAFSGDDCAEPLPQSLEQLAPGKGTFFDERVDMKDPGGAILTQRVLEILANGIPRERKRSGDAQADHEIRIRKLIANGLRCHFFRDPPRTSHYRKADKYLDKPRWMRGLQLAGGVDDLEKVGLVTALGFKRTPKKAQAYTSSYLVSPEMVRLAEECGVTDASINRYEPLERLVRLYQKRPGRYYDFELGRLVRPPKGERIMFEPIPETQDLTERLAALNAFYDQQDISIGLTAEQLDFWIKKRNREKDRSGAPYRSPERLQTDLCRIFNNGLPDDPKFDQGGRLAGGWWMAVPKELRGNITINSQPTLELDFSACHPRMLYHDEGIDYAEDAYSLPEIEAYERAMCLPSGTYRPCVKWAMPVLINCRGRPDMADRPDDVEVPPDIDLMGIIGFIEAKHQRIAGAFKTGAGMRLMKRESDIALNIIETAARRGWTILPIHDSFITETKRHRELYHLMKEAYFQEFNKYPIIK